MPEKRGGGGTPLRTMPPGESSVAFMLMIDLKANDETCIFSTMHFIVGQAKKYNADPILTFDQSLYQKSYEIQWKE